MICKFVEIDAELVCHILRKLEKKSLNLLVKKRFNNLVKFVNIVIIQVRVFSECTVELFVCAVSFISEMVLA